MAFDAGFLSKICREICEELAASRLEKIYQCTRDTFVFEFRAAKKPRSLFVSAGPSGGFCHLTERKIAHPDTPPMFCMLLRKHLTGGRFVRASQIGFERVLRLDIEFTDAFGQPLLRSLFLEAMGKSSNLILCDENGVILGALRTLDLAQSPDRPLLCGMAYVPPPARAGAVSLFDGELVTAVREKIACADPQEFVWRAVLDTVGGIAPTVAKEVVYRSQGDSFALCETCNIDDLIRELSTLQNTVLSKKSSFCVIYDEGAVPFKVIEYSYLLLTQYEGLSRRVFDSPSRLLDTVLGEREQNERLRQRTERASSVLKAAQRRLRKKLDAQLSDYAQADLCDQKRLYGDLIMQEIWRIRRGDTRLVATDYQSGKEVEIALDERLSPSQNAQRYYKQYQRSRRALIALEEQLSLTREELAYADSIAEALIGVQTAEEADEICREVSAWTYGKRFQKEETARTKQKKKTPGIQVASLESPNGFLVFVGKNNLQNEELTFHIALKNDYWFHAKDRPGPHVVLHVEGGEEPREADFEFAARLAVPRDLASVSCEIDCTKIKNVKHHSARLPGRVIYTGAKTIYLRNKD